MLGVGVDEVLVRVVVDRRERRARSGSASVEERRARAGEEDRLELARVADRLVEVERVALGAAGPHVGWFVRDVEDLRLRFDRACARRLGAPVGAALAGQARCGEALAGQLAIRSS